MIGSVVAVALFALTADPTPAPGSAGKSAIQGQYIESRTADIYTGPCFSNAEVFIAGDQAVLAWKINKGQFQGVELNGLTVAAAVQGNNTFSEEDPTLSKSVILVDKAASASQRDALVAFAKHMSGNRLGKVVEVRVSMLCMTLEEHQAKLNETASSSEHSGHQEAKAPAALFWAPGLAEIQARPIGDGDHFCGNETVAYAPLSKDVKVLPAYTLAHSFKGKALGSTWSVPNNRSTFVGSFATTGK